ncbi:Fe-S oxidoreductase [Candidatus Scalindua japonica]|uniref:Fe-S oxidoreductase n=1 Tax=Candidatus Scalindua japonica TaxID=1284222 RepID=A0A286TX19_9BACT|nr:radical SAM protein [Candidatus Scalindua japonica]GAX60434.1 Fe-S oxidoreductase [Candidatus Scalindua japonica]
MVDLILVRSRNNPNPGVKKNSDSGSYSGRRMPPYGIMYISSFVRQSGYTVKLFDLFKKNYAHLSIDDIADQILTHDPGIVGISSMTSQSLDAMALGDALMRKSNVSVVHGGVHPTSLPEETLKHGHVVVQGEGEHCMRQITSSKPICSQRKIFQGKPLTEEEMDSIPFPKKEDLDETAFDPSLDPKFPIITARGCPYKCVFCKDGFRSSNKRFHSVDYIVEFLGYISQTLGFRKIIVLDDIFIYSEQRMEEMIIKLEKRNLKFKFQCQVHANVITPRVLRLMKRLGIQWIYIGIESGNQQILKNIKKGITIEKASNAVHLLKKNGFYVAGMYMIGNIGETSKTVNDTIRFAFTLPTDRAWFSFAAPYPGTQFYDMADKYGKIIEPDFCKWNQATLVYLPKDIKKDEMYQLMRRAQIVRIIKKIRFSFFGCWITPIKELYYRYKRRVLKQHAFND